MIIFASDGTFSRAAPSSGYLLVLQPTSRCNGSQYSSSSVGEETPESDIIVNHAGFSRDKTTSPGQDEGWLLRDGTARDEYSAEAGSLVWRQLLLLSRGKAACLGNFSATSPSTPEKTKCFCRYL